MNQQIILWHIKVTLYGFLLFWFIPHREVASILLDTCEAGMRVGDVDNAMYALCLMQPLWENVGWLDIDGLAWLVGT